MCELTIIIGVILAISEMAPFVKKRDNYNGILHAIISIMKKSEKVCDEIKTIEIPPSNANV